MKRFREMVTFIVVALCARISADVSPVVDLASIEHAQIDVDTLTVSGLSSGGFMANIMHYVFSSKVKGSGIFAGGPFNIAYNISLRGFTPAYAVNVLTAVAAARSQSDLESQTVSLADQGTIDPLTNINGSRSYVYQGNLDPTTLAIFGLSEKVVNIYKHFGSDVKFLQLPFGTHCVPTDNYGSPCAISNMFDDGLNNCDIESIFEMFSHLYGNDYKNPKSSSTPYTGTLYNFDQSPYAPSGNASTDFMNDHGGIYIPLACHDANATCKLHVAFHGCIQVWIPNIFYDKWAVHAGYLQVADQNNIIVVFPRTASFGVQLSGTANFGCWDCFGGTTTSAVPFKKMPQVKSVTNILNGMIGTEFFN